jgi:hypothetical protein
MGDFLLSTIKVFFGYFLSDILWIPFSIFIMALSKLSNSNRINNYVVKSEKIMGWVFRILIILAILKETGIYDTWYKKAIFIVILTVYLVNFEIAKEYLISHNKVPLFRQDPLHIRNTMLINENNQFISNVAILGCIILISFSYSPDIDFLTIAVQKYFLIYDISLIKIAIIILIIINYFNTLRTASKYLMNK